MFKRSPKKEFNELLVFWDSLSQVNEDPLLKTKPAVVHTRPNPVLVAKSREKKMDNHCTRSSMDNSRLLSSISGTSSLIVSCQSQDVRPSHKEGQTGVLHHSNLASETDRGNSQSKPTLTTPVQHQKPKSDYAIPMSESTPTMISSKCNADIIRNDGELSSVTGVQEKKVSRITRFLRSTGRIFRCLSHHERKGWSKL